MSNNLNINKAYKLLGSSCGWCATKRSFLDKLNLTKAQNNCIRQPYSSMSASQSSNSYDNFTKEFMNNRISVSPLQGALLTAGSALMAIIDPHRQDMIAALGEVTGTKALHNIYKRMNESPEGRTILALRPRINTRTMNLEALRKLPEDTLGHVYVQFLDTNRVTPDSRLDVHFLDDVNHGYVMQRYRECHDIVHAVLGMPTHMLGEVTVKWIEALNTGLPMCLGGALFGAMRLRPKQRSLYVKHYLPWALRAGPGMSLLLAVHWENRWEQPIDELRQELNIDVLELPDTEAIPANLFIIK